MNRLHFKRSWFLVAVWVALINFLSGPQFAGAKTQPAVIEQVHAAAPQLSSSQARKVAQYLRKHAHVAEYAMLTFLLAWALQRQGFPPRKPSWRTAFAVLAVVLVVASIDEWHQTFVPGRDGCMADVLIDVGGAGVGLVILRLFGRPPPVDDACALVGVSDVGPAEGRGPSPR